MFKYQKNIQPAARFCFSMAFCMAVIHGHAAQDAMDTAGLKSPW